MSKVFQLLSCADIEVARELIESEGLRFESDYDDLVGIFEDARLLGCGARKGRVLKMLVVAPTSRGGNVLSDIITSLMAGDKNARAAGYFIFTKPCAIASFQRLGFRLLVETPKAGMLEYRNGIERHFQGLPVAPAGAHNGCIVVDADPLLSAELVLIEQAAARVDKLYVILAGEGRNTFSIETRLQLATLAVTGLANVELIDAGPYLLNEADFPGYFLPTEAARQKLYIEMQSKLLAQHLAPLLSIDKYFINTSMIFECTADIEQLLAKHHIDLIVLSPSAQAKDRQQINDFLKLGNLQLMFYCTPAACHDYLRYEILNNTNIHSQQRQKNA